jgi:4-diphosphocytidyl-2-C-methyl-D-erythritol kinase
MYQKLDAREQISPLHKSEKIIKALENKNIELLVHNLYNVFENVIEPKEKIQSLKKELIKNGAIGSVMTGSGSCVYGIFENKNKAKLAYQKLKKQYEVYITTSYNSRRRKYYDK